MKDETLVGTVEYDNSGELCYFPEAILAPLTLRNLVDLAKFIHEHD